MEKDELVRKYQEETGQQLPGHVVRRIDRLYQDPVVAILQIELFKSEATSWVARSPDPVEVFVRKYSSNKRYSQILKRYRKVLRKVDVPELPETRGLRYFHLNPEVVARKKAKSRLMSS